MKYLRNALVFIVVIVSLGVAYVWYDYVSLAAKENVALRDSPSLEEGKISIGIIGDSWAAGRKIDDALIYFMKQNRVKASVVS